MSNEDAVLMSVESIRGPVADGTGAALKNFS